MAREGLPDITKLGLAPLRVPAGHLLGAHMSIAGGTPNAITRAVALGSTAVQIFVKNNNQWVGKPLGPDEPERFRTQRRDADNMACFAHACYLINLGSPDDTHWRRSIDAMVDEVERCTALGVPGLVVHPGSHLGRGEEFGLARIARAIEEIADRTPGSTTQIYIESTAGQGAWLGGRFEHLADLIARVRCKDRIGVCLDTCHMFAAGYDLRTPDAYEATMADFGRIVGFGWLRAFHVNDSKGELGRHLDRHEHLGHGRIGPAGFAMLLRDRRLRDIPKVLETPKGDDGSEDWANMEFMIACLTQEGVPTPKPIGSSAPAAAPNSKAKPAKPATRKPVAKRAATKKPAQKKPTQKKPAAKKAAAKKIAPKKSAPKKRVTKKSPAAAKKKSASRARRGRAA